MCIIVYSIVCGNVRSLPPGARVWLFLSALITESALSCPPEPSSGSHKKDLRKQWANVSSPFPTMLFSSLTISLPALVDGKCKSLYGNCVVYLNSYIPDLLDSSPVQYAKFQLIQYLIVIVMMSSMSRIYIISIFCKTSLSISIFQENPYQIFDKCPFRYRYQYF